MNIRQEIKNKSVGFRKAILAVVLFVLGLPLLVVVLLNAQKRLANFNQENFVQDLNLPAGELVTSTDYFSQSLLELEQALRLLEEINRAASTTPTSTVGIEEEEFF